MASQTNGVYRLADSVKSIEWLAAVDSKPQQQPRKFYFTSPPLLFTDRHRLTIPAMLLHIFFVMGRTRKSFFRFFPVATFRGGEVTTKNSRLITGERRANGRGVCVRMHTASGTVQYDANVGNDWSSRNTNTTCELFKLQPPILGHCFSGYKPFRTEALMIVMTRMMFSYFAAHLWDITIQKKTTRNRTLSYPIVAHIPEMQRSQDSTTVGNTL